MKKTLLALAIGVMSVVTPLAMAAPASAEPKAEAWYCASAWGFDPIPAGQYWGCPQTNLLIVDLYSNKHKRLLNGTCANQLWNSSTRPRPTVAQAYQKCTIRVY